jgi:hypothetical protein
MHGQAVLYATRPAVLDAAWLHRDIVEDEAHLLPLDDALADLHSSAHGCVVAPDKPLEFDRRGGLLPSPLVCDLLTRGGLAVKRYDAGEGGSLVVVALINPCTWTEGPAGADFEPTWGRLVQQVGAAAAPVCCNAEHFRAAAAGGAAPRWNALQPMPPRATESAAAAAAGCPMCGFQVTDYIWGYLLGLHIWLHIRLHIGIGYRGGAQYKGRPESSRSICICVLRPGA